MQNIFFYSKGASLPLKPISMVLQGVIDAAVGGGVAMYQKAFLTPEFAASNPDAAPIILQLKQKIALQVDILDRGSFASSLLLHSLSLLSFPALHFCLIATIFTSHLYQD